VAAAADLNESRLLESSERLSHGDPAHLQLLGELTLGRKALADGDDA
jgi:hypothetical protein